MQVAISSNTTPLGNMGLLTQLKIAVNGLNIKDFRPSHLMKNQIKSVYKALEDFDTSKTGRLYGGIFNVSNSVQFTYSFWIVSNKNKPYSLHFYARKGCYSDEYEVVDITKRNQEDSFSCYIMVKKGDIKSTLDELFLGNYYEEDLRDTWCF